MTIFSNKSMILKIAKKVPALAIHYQAIPDPEPALPEGLLPDQPEKLTHHQPKGPPFGQRFCVSADHSRQDHRWVGEVKLGHQRCWSALWTSANFSPTGPFQLAHEPKNQHYQGKSCLSVSLINGRVLGGWNDLTYSEKQPFICKWRPGFTY